MKNLRRFGKAPYSVAVIHGGPGARGEMLPVAKALAQNAGVLEPLQTAHSIDGQVKELLITIKKYGKLPIILIGHSWGAWLSYIFTARYPSLVRKLILVASGPFEEKYVPVIMQTRLNRLNIKEREELNIYIALMNKQKVGNKNIKDLLKPSDKGVEFVKFGELMNKTDNYQPIPSDNKVEMRLEIIQSVWPKAEELRHSGILLGLANKIKCSVVAIHGDYDPHPYPGVRKPLSQHIKDFRFILLKKCGHCPWLEYFARDRFYKVLKKELT